MAWLQSCWVYGGSGTALGTGLQSFSPRLVLLIVGGGRHGFGWKPLRDVGVREKYDFFVALEYGQPRPSSVHGDSRINLRSDTHILGLLRHLAEYNEEP